jgi:hypothetical protein
MKRFHAMKGRGNGRTIVQFLESKKRNSCLQPRRVAAIAPVPTFFFSYAHEDASGGYLRQFFEDLEKRLALLNRLSEKDRLFVGTGGSE